MSTPAKQVYCVTFQVPGLGHYGPAKQYPEAESPEEARMKVLSQYPEAEILSVKLS